MNATAIYITLTLAGGGLGYAATIPQDLRKLRPLNMVLLPVVLGSQKSPGPARTIGSPATEASTRATPHPQPHATLLRRISARAAVRRPLRRR